MSYPFRPSTLVVHRESRLSDPGTGPRVTGGWRQERDPDRAQGPVGKSHPTRTRFGAGGT